MSEDIIEKIDATLLADRNARRFDPFGGDVWDEDRVDRWGDGMRVRPARTSAEEEPEPPEAAVEMPELLTLEDVTPSTLQIRRRSPEERRAYLAEQRAWHVANGAPECWLSTFDSLAEAVVEPPPPTTDRVAEAFRTEVRRQGLAPCEIQIDGPDRVAGRGVAARDVAADPGHRPVGELRDAGGMAAGQPHRASCRCRSRARPARGRRFGGLRRRRAAGKRSHRGLPSPVPSAPR